MCSFNSLNTHITNASHVPDSVLITRDTGQKGRVKQVLCVYVCVCVGGCSSEWVSNGRSHEKVTLAYSPEGEPQALLKLGFSLHSPLCEIPYSTGNSRLNLIKEMI
jgi:hypothetical protein